MKAAIAVVLALCLSSIPVLLLLRHYLPLRTTPAYLLVPVFLALALPCSIVFLVPIDLSRSSDPELLVTWRVAYWLTFALTWLILPILGEYCDSGHRHVSDRLRYSLHRNARYYMYVFGAGAIGLVYFLYQNGMHVASVKGLVMALAYAWGLVLAIALMGHGIVALPRKLFREATVEKRLVKVECSATQVKSRLNDAISELDNTERTFRRLKTAQLPPSLRNWVEEVEIPYQPPLRSDPAIPNVVTEAYLAELTRKLKRARYKKARRAEEWNSLLQHAKSYRETQTNCNKSKITWYIHMRALPALRLSAAFLLSLAGAALIFSEIIQSFSPRLSLINLTIPRSGHPTKITPWGEAISALWLLYMNTTILYSMTRLRIWGNRALVKRTTYPESACWYGAQIAKLAVPISYNFITLLPPSAYRGTAFYGFLGKEVDLTPLGAAFSSFFPLVLILMVAGSFYAGSRVEGDEGDVEEGISLLRREGRLLIAAEGMGMAGPGSVDEDVEEGDDSPRHFYQDLAITPSYFQGAPMSWVRNGMDSAASFW
ncbi:hypothetical protein K470DRAFT_299553 [Piedraia hortae CBS 480.64]|uniref:Uncharacterized protein n=1 Tax=Piedraia hortae CBS 480.64 TaxID=1314780 RepID=A0A6A7BZT6_9PEZI|nr:hypothetical protein K470DRAFT_299553 [Piedraia hortae CBS 480.64]